MAAKLGTGVDPSYPAFRVPFTDLTENCHRPFWAEDVLQGGGGDAGVNDAGVSDAGAGDAGAGSGEAGGYDAGPCVPYGGDCTSGLCCSAYQCLDNTPGGFSCLSP